MSVAFKRTNQDHKLNIFIISFDQFI